MEDKFDMDNAIQTEAEFSYASTVMNRIGGSEEGNEQENWMRAKIRYEHLGLNKSCSLQRTEPHAKL